jgi:hypothetical protein
MSKLFAAGDTLPLYGRVSSLQGELQDRDKAGSGEVSGGDGSVCHCCTAGGTQTVNCTSYTNQLTRSTPHHDSQQIQRLANMELLTHLSTAHGRCLGSSSLETIGIASK